MNITNEQRANLEKLASYLLALPDDYEHFDMREYFSVPNEDDNKFEWNPIGLTQSLQLYETCGTVACAIGHGPAAGVPVGDHDFTWNNYSVRVFGLERSSRGTGYQWEWCFSDNWTYTDNTPHGAGKRILWMLQHGLPEDCGDQMRGQAPLCYEEE